MDSPVIDNTHTRAICDEIGERLRTLLKSTAPDERPDFDGKIDQLRDVLAEPE
jgi:hypothetical protein